MFVSDIYPEAKRAFAGCDETEVLRRLTDAVSLLSNAGILDVNLGEMELCVCSGCTTLPRGVGTVLGIDVCGNPTLIQDQWFKYHINGPGTRSHSACGVITEMGQVCTYRDPSEPFYLIAEVTSAADNNKKLRVFANDVDGKKIFSAGPDGKLYEGFLVPMVFGFSKRNPSTPPIGNIYRIQREATKDFVKLIAIRATDGVSQTQIGHYEPDEVLPTYRRIKVPNKTSVLVKYKKANLELRSQRDWINLDNRQALYLACRAIKFQNDDKFDQARASESEAVRILNQEAESKLPSGPRVPQIIQSLYLGENDDLFYGGGGSYYGGPY